MKKINRKDIVEHLSEEMHYSKKEVRELFDGIIEMITSSLLAGEEVNISGFGVLEPKNRKARVGTDPKNHNKILLEAAKTITFRPCKELKLSLNHQ